MSNNTELITSMEAQIAELHNSVAAKLDDLKANVVECATLGADLGDYLDQWSKEIHLHGEALTNKLASLGIRTDVSVFARRAAHARRRGLLDDPAQLQFALADGSQDASTGTAPQRQDTNEVMRLISQASRMRQQLADWTKREPVAKWDKTVRQSVAEQLKPLVELYQQLATV